MARLSASLEQEYFPGNPITANLLGSATFVHNGRPASFVLDAIRRTSNLPNDVLNYYLGDQDTQVIDKEQIRNPTITEGARGASGNIDKLLGRGGVNRQNPTDNQPINDQQLDYLLRTSAGMSSEEAAKLSGLSTTDVEQLLTTNDGSFCSQFNNDGLVPWLSICNFAEDATTRIMVSILGVILLALGIWSLR